MFGSACAVQVDEGSPSLVWSAGEDGTLRQHDLRERAACQGYGGEGTGRHRPSNTDCKSILVSAALQR